MTVRVRVTVDGAKKAVRQFRDDAGRFASPLPPLLTRLGDFLATEMQSNIINERIPLPRLHPQTLAIRAYYGHAGKPKLIRDGSLVKSIRTLRVGSSDVDAGTDHVFPSGNTAAQLERGGNLTDKRGRKRYVQPFPFIVTTEEMERGVEALVAEYYVFK